MTIPLKKVAARKNCNSLSLKQSEYTNMTSKMGVYYTMNTSNLKFS